MGSAIPLTKAFTDMTKEVKMKPVDRVYTGCLATYNKCNDCRLNKANHSTVHLMSSGQVFSPL